MKRVGILLYDLPDLTGGGGSERFWADFFELYKKYPLARFKIFLFCDENSFNNLKQVNRLKDHGNVVFLKLYHNRFKYPLEFFFFYLKLILYRIKIVHIGEYNSTYFPLLHRLGKIPSSFRPRISLTLVNCMIPYKYHLEPGFKKPIDQISKVLKCEGILVWYELLKEFMIGLPFLHAKPPVVNTKFCFSDLQKFRPSSQKQNLIVYAARLNEQKKPLLFIEALEKVKADCPDKLKSWKVLICGKGPQESIVSERIREKNLDGIVTMAHAADMSEIFSRSKCFVSTQDYENFTSLSMLEAMASGNVIVSRNVGQTNYFARSNQNAFLAHEDTVDGIAAAIIEFLDSGHLHESMMKESIRIATEEHTKENFFMETENYWSSILNAG